MVRNGQLRRSHRKSRAGCLECKRRHVKCDEQRPKCILCTLAGRECGYASPIIVGHQAPPRSQLPSSSVDGTSTSPEEVRSDDGSNIHAAGLDAMGYAMQIPAVLPPDPNGEVNLIHLELLIHFHLEDYIQGVTPDMVDPASQLLLRSAMEAPYLMHQVLALSARRLAVLRPLQDFHYLHQAAQLQTRALAIFHKDQAPVDEFTCVPTLLFISLLGRHLLTDAFSRRDLEPGMFLHALTHTFGMYQSFRNAAYAAWEYVADAEPWPSLIWGLKVEALTTRGTETQSLTTLVCASCELSDVDKKACLDMVHHLQVALDLRTRGHAADPERWRQIVFSWTLAAPAGFIEMLGAQRAEALVVLAHYAVLLHHARDMWQIGDAGEYLFGTIEHFLGPAWEFWLTWPREQIISMF